MTQKIVFQLVRVNSISFPINTVHGKYFTSFCSNNSLAYSSEANKGNKCVSVTTMMHCCYHRNTYAEQMPASRKCSIN